MRRTVSSLTTISVLGLVALTTGDASAVIVGPDTFGYRAVDQADGAVYAYIDISGGVPFLVNQDDTLSPPQALGAPFTFYGTPLPSLRASSNGFLTSSGNSASFTNSCGPINAGGGGEHIAPLHDDLIASVYYAYLDQAAAAAAGYPGETAGISVFQWEGRYFNDVNSTVDFETILFHDDGTILNLVAAATQGGSSSTSGIHSGAGNFTLVYACNTPASLVGGATAVRYTPPPEVSINEVRIEQSGADNDEYFELVGPPGASLDGLTYIVLGDSGGGATGTIEAVVPLSGSSIPASGYFVVAESTFSIGTADLEFPTALIFENDDTVGHLLVRSFTGVLNQTLDVGADGTLDTQPWFSINDAVTAIDGTSTELVYAPGSACVASTQCSSIDPAGAPDHIFRCGDASGTWNDGLLDELAVPPSDSPGAPNPCACGDGVLVIGEVCDAGGESIMCDDDCTLPVCGDGNPNMLAGEVCDDGGESAMCNADCTAAICGDGVTNVTAGEVCDDEGESVMCDDDCTAPSCGDGNTNETAGEACDDGGESATCNDDCTVATCGDEIVNEAAGETCDDGGRSGTCNANCTTASCGDGIFNATAGEECDGDGNGTPGQTATCDADCTAAMCGDMVVNDAAAEECDAGAEADDCDDDCTAPSCGDSNVNEAAGEECDDGNTDDGDGCSATCIEEEEPGTSSGEESSSGGEESSSGGSEDSTTTDDPTDATGDTSATDPDSSGTDPDTSGSASVTDSDTNDEDSDTNDEDTDGEDESSSGGTGASAGDDGCGCNTTDERDLTATLLAFFGLGALRRRRRRA